ncbi:MAG: 2-polyprenylphenol 6-hydroxylase [Deltaproteobacteria bacterium]|nr:2-polyprenylphenol 6-hydroxylase [Deltaproteobacteria bacterium]
MTTFQTIRNIGRLNKIVRTLIRYGFGGLVHEMRLVPFISTIDRLFLVRKKGRGKSVPQRIRLVLEELGPTFIKLGQLASTRADLLPADWIEEMKKLQDMVPPVAFDEVRKTVEKSLKAPLGTLFLSFDQTPVASASIAQVHFAELRDGRKVAVKVRRPGIAPLIEADVSVMRTIAEFLEKYVPASRRYRPIEVVNEFARVIDIEQDLTIEGVNINRFESLFKDDTRLKVPHVYWDYTTTEVLTLERIAGTPIDEAAELTRRGLDVRTVAMNGVELFFRQVFEFGVFHADLHPGNLFVRDDGVIVYLDFGIVGRLDRDLRHYLANMLYYLVRKDYYRMAVLHREMGLIDQDVSIAEFEEALRDIAEPIFGRTLEHISISTLLMKLLHTARHFKMALQPNLLLLQKSMVIIEGVGRQLYPDINMWEVAKPLIYKWMFKEKFSPKTFAEKRLKDAGELADAAFDLPIRVNETLKRTLRDELKISFVHHRLEIIADEMEGAGRRIGGGFLAGSLVVAATVVTLAVRAGASVFLGIPPLAWIGYGLAVIVVLRAASTRRRGPD